MLAEKYIREYNNLDGKPATRETLVHLRDSIKAEFQSRRIDKHSPFGLELHGIQTRLSMALKAQFSEVEVVRVKKINIDSYIKMQTAKAYQKRVTRLPKQDHSELLHGLECIDDDTNLDAKPLDGLNDTTYKVITDKILELIKSDGLIWRKPWNEKVSGPTDMAHNHVTKHLYRGGNYYLNYLLLKDFSNPKFFTFNQVTKLGGKVKAGAEGFPVVYFKWLYKDIAKQRLVDPQIALTPEGRLKPGFEKIPGLFYYRVFNYDQCEGLNIKVTPSKKRTEKEKIESAERILDEMPKRPKIKSGNEAWYRPSDDLVQLVPIEKFKVDQHYYSVSFHELIHSTGHVSRVGRKLEGAFGSKNYAFEELIAELGASYLCGESGILYHTLKNSAAYIQGWSKKLREEMIADPKFFLQAASQAQKAADFMLARGEYHDLKKIKKETEPREKVREKVKHEARKSVRPPVKKPVEQVKQKAQYELELAGRPKKIRKRKSTGLMGAEDIASMKFTRLNLTEPYLRDFNRLYSDTMIMLWAAPGSGKTVYALKLGQYLAEKLNMKVLYVAKEEMNRSTFTEKIIQFNIGHPNLKFSKELVGVNVDDFDAIIFDSVQALAMDLPEFQQFIKEHPGKLLVPIIQSTKDGDFRGGKDWEHEVDIAGEIVDRKFVARKNRLDEEFYKKREKHLLDKAVAEKKKKELIKEQVNPVEASKPA